VLGIRPTENENLEYMVMKHFQDTRRIENNRYVVSWLWKVEIQKYLDYTSFLTLVRGSVRVYGWDFKILPA